MTDVCGTFFQQDFTVRVIQNQNNYNISQYIVKLFKKLKLYLKTMTNYLDIPETKPHM